MATDMVTDMAMATVMVMVMAMAMAITKKQKIKFGKRISLASYSLEEKQRFSIQQATNIFTKNRSII